jgi:hypothetical protein
MKTGVLVMAYGTPTTPDDVEAYYTRIRHGHAPTAALLSDLGRRSPSAPPTRWRALPGPSKP